MKEMSKNRNKLIPGVQKHNKSNLFPNIFHWILSHNDKTTDATDATHEL